MSYRYLVLPHDASWSVSPVVLEKIKELADGGRDGHRPPTDRSAGPDELS